MLSANPKKLHTYRPGTAELTFHRQFAFIFFYGQSDRAGEGFKLNIRDDGSEDSPKDVIFRKKESTFNLRYPQDEHSTSKYDNHKVFLILGAPPLGTSIRVTVSQIHTEEIYDVVSLYWMNSTSGNPISCIT